MPPPRSSNCHGSSFFKVQQSRLPTISNVVSEDSPHWSNRLHVSQILHIRTKSVLTYNSGGSVLSELLQPETNILPKHSISVLIRGEEKVDVFKNLGVTPILFNSLDETDLLRTIASEHDSKRYADLTLGYTYTF